MKCLLCGVITGPQIEKIQEQLVNAMKYCGMAELRLDYFEEINVEEIKNIKFSVCLTLRSKEQGGRYTGSEKERLEKLRELALCNAEYIDLEYFLPDFECQSKIIRSYHDFEKFSDPEEVLCIMKQRKADIYKMAFSVHSSVEALKLLQFMKIHPDVVVMGMGLYGESTRILGPLFGAKFVYASLDQETAPGQLSAKELNEIYHFKDLNPSTAIYGLIGYPVNKSIGHLFHNQVMHQKNAVYVKFPVLPEHLNEFIEISKKLHFRGLSVTMPLKELVIPLLDEIDPWAKRVGAVNTLVFQNGKIKGYNTDGKGALDAIESKIKVEGKKVMIIGAGGASKAIIAEAIDRGAEVKILNRDVERAKKLADQFNCWWGALDQTEDYDILINATSIADPIDSKWILCDCLFMDINSNHVDTHLIQEAKAKNCQIIYGSEMFINQAKEQLKLWFGDEAWQATALGKSFE